MTIIPFPGSKEQSGCGCDKPRHTERLSLPVSRREFARIRFDGNPEEAVKPLLPMEALARLEMTLGQGVVPDLVVLSGPGDPLAEPDRTLEILGMLHDKHPAIQLGITTLGIHGEQLVADLVKSGVAQITMVIDAVDQSIMQSLYAWIRPGNKTVPLSRAVAILQDEQLRALRSFCLAGIRVTVKTTVYPGYNDAHIDEIVYRAANHGAEAMMILPYRAQADEPDMPQEPDGEMMDLIHSRAAKRIKVVGPTRNDKDLAAIVSPMMGKGLSNSLAKPTRERPRVAVVSSNGMEVDLHLGHAIKVLIYGPREDGLVCLLESRDAPEPGGGGTRWDALADILQDCFALLAASAGENPREILGHRGISVMIVEDEIEGVVDVLYGGGKKKNRNKRSK